MKLQHELDDLMQIGEMTLETFVKHVSPYPNETLVFNNSGEVMSQPLDKPWIELLKSMDGKRTLDQILKITRMKENGDLFEFIEFCLDSGILSFGVRT